MKEEGGDYEEEPGREQVVVVVEAATQHFKGVLQGAIRAGI